MWMRFLQVVAILAATSQAATAGTQFGSIHLGQSGGALASEKDGAFAFCAATQLSKAAICSPSLKIPIDCGHCQLRIQAGVSRPMTNSRLM